MDADDQGPPYTAVIFTNQRTGADPEGYVAAAARMEALARDQPGFSGLESVRSDDGAGITVSYWATEAAARAWKQESEHLVAQAAGRERWYSSYRVRIATVEREYSYDRAHGSHSEHTDPSRDSSEPAMNEPDEILHIALPDDWTAARQAGEYRISTRGVSLDDEGFVHCSYPRQLETVANRFYGDVPELVLLHVEPDLLEAEIRVEPATDGGDELFPHVYGAIPTAAVVATTWWDRGDDGVWHRPQTM